MTTHDGRKRPEIGSLDLTAKNRLDALLDEVEVAVDAYSGRRRGVFRQSILHRIKAQDGIASRSPDHGLRFQYGWLNEAERPVLLAAISHAIRHVEQFSSGEPQAVLARRNVMSRPRFEERLNEILTQAGYGIRLHDAEWQATAETEADELLQMLLQDSGDEMAECKQGDVQQEMVASSVQSRLSRHGSVIIDYGAGLGRVGEGLSTASRFGEAKYVAVDSPVTDKLRDVLARLGGQTDAMEREVFLDGEMQADVITVVNTLHHVPFADLGTDFARLLRRLKPDGELLIHEMGELPKPEKKNVPWLMADIELLFASIEALQVNARSTTTRGKRLPLTHAIVTLTGALPNELRDMLDENARAVWRQMKERQVEQIRSLQAMGRPDDILDLRRALIVNGNLDLNLPTQRTSL